MRASPHVFPVIGVVARTFVRPGSKDVSGRAGLGAQRRGGESGGTFDRLQADLKILFKNPVGFVEEQLN
jgi:hypothetical protein